MPSPVDPNRHLRRSPRFARGPLLAGLVLATACRPSAQPSALVPASPSFAAAAPSASTTKPASAWDVQNPPGARVRVPIDTDEGTWQSVDVSPDGKTIAFDLLGDIYVMPRTGGLATPLATGMAWQVQPRFRPDGTRIAFISDQGGADNVWTMRTDGSDARAVTHELERLVTTPTWTPDGQYLAVRKHITGTRSLGAGEIWLYHHTGTQGMVVVDRRNDQKDLGEPAFSPDGRYLYYSQDTTPGDTFEYDRNPHGQLYVIKRLDLEEQRTDVFVEGPGGAVRPTPSRDGRSLAFVRRQGTETVLFVQDLDSGELRPIYRELDRDMQETWAIFGTYPQLAWTQEGTLVFWAGGKIREIDPRTRVSKVIPFRVRDEREVVPALRFSTEVHPATFHTKMLRFVRVDPTGHFVAFEALGQLYLRDRRNGATRRLSRDEGVRELHPSFSADGEWVVYTTWDDEKLGTVRMVRTHDPKVSRVLSTRPGHYVEPAFSRDGGFVVVRRAASDVLRDPRYSRDPGLYRIPIEGGNAERIVREGELPHFTETSDRVFYLARGSKPASGPSAPRDTFELRSIDLDGSDPRTHVVTHAGTELRVSPDGRFLALGEYGHAYVFPFSALGRPIDLGHKSEIVPHVRVTKDAGKDLHWSRDGRTLYSSHGPRLFEARLDAFANELGLATAAATAAAPKATAGSTVSAGIDSEGVDLGFDVPSDAPKGLLALTNGRIVTMRGNEVFERGTILIRDHRILEVGPSESVTVPRGAKTVDLTGLTVFPGLIDVHDHGLYGKDGIIPEQNFVAMSLLSFGVTTIHDPSAPTELVFSAGELARAGRLVAPRTFSTGTVLYGGDQRRKAIIENLDDARIQVRRRKAVGAISVKSYSQPRRSQRQQLIAAAREEGLLVVPEGRSMLETDLSLVVDGHTGVEHNLPVARVYADITQLWSRTEVGLTPTLTVGYGGLGGENYWYQHTEVFRNERLRAFVPPFVYEPRARRRLMASDGDWNHIRVAEACNTLHKAGVHLQLGGHGQREGLGPHWELWSFVQGGMSNLEALRLATQGGARYLGLDGDLGSIAPGKLADLSIVAGNPLHDIRVSERVRYTVLNGRLYDAATLDELHPTPRKRARFYWEASTHSGS